MSYLKSRQRGTHRRSARGGMHMSMSELTGGGWLTMVTFGVQPPVLLRAGPGSNSRLP